MIRNVLSLPSINNSLVIPITILGFLVTGCVEKKKLYLSGSYEAEGYGYVDFHPVHLDYQKFHSGVIIERGKYSHVDNRLVFTPAYRDSLFQLTHLGQLDTLTVTEFTDTTFTAYCKTVDRYFKNADENFATDEEYNKLNYFSKTNREKRGKGFANPNYWNNDNFKEGFVNVIALKDHFKSESRSKVALAYCNAGIEAFPDSLGLSMMRAEIRFELGHYWEAFLDYKKFEYLETFYEDPQSGIGLNFSTTVLHLKEEDSYQAIYVILNILIERLENDNNAQLLGQCYRNLGYLKAAIQSMNRLDPINGIACDDFFKGAQIGNQECLKAYIDYCN